MAKMVTSALVMLIATLHLATAEPGCSLTQEWMEGAAMSCMAHEPSLMLQVAEHMNNPSQMETMGFVCGHTNSIVDMAACLEKKVLKCFPQAQLLTNVLPDRKHLAKAVDIMCSNQKAFLDPNCMTQEVNQDFTKCVQGHVQEILSKVFSLDTHSKVQVAVCEVVAGTQACLDLYHGTSCPKESVEAFKQFLASIVPTEDCSVLENGHNGHKLDNGKLKDALQSFLIGGQPLKFEKEPSLPKVPYTGA